MSILDKVCIALLSAVVSFTACYYACICSLTTHASYLRIAAKSSLLVFFAAFGVLHAYRSLLAVGQIRRQIVACAWMLASAVGLVAVKFCIVL